jgi:hypothetical protein
LLDSRFSDHVHPDRLLLHGKKKSNSYIIYLPDLSRFISDCGCSDMDRLVFPFTYSYCWRWASRIGVGKRLNGHTNKSVLHLSRFIFSDKCSGRESSDVIGECLRHRSRSSVSFYLNKGV